MVQKSRTSSVFGSAALLFLPLLAPGPALACTNLVTSPAASISGYATLSYTADGTHTYGGLYHFPRGDHAPGSRRKCYSWDNGKLTAVIPEANHTYNVVGNVNEKHLAIGETTFGGLADLARDDDGIDYGSLIYIALQRTKNCREAIHLMGVSLRGSARGGGGGVGGGGGRGAKFQIQTLTPLRPAPSAPPPNSPSSTSTGTPAAASPSPASTPRRLSSLR